MENRDSRNGLAVESVEETADIVLNQVLEAGSGGAVVVVGKFCPRCKVEKPREAFGNHRNRPDGLQVWCKACVSSLKPNKGKKDVEREASKEEKAWDAYMKQLYQDCLKPGAPANTRDLYATLVGKKVERKEILLGLNADEIARRNLSAAKELEAEAKRQLMKEMEGKDEK